MPREEFGEAVGGQRFEKSQTAAGVLALPLPDLTHSPAARAGQTRDLHQQQGRKLFELCLAAGLFEFCLTAGLLELCFTKRESDGSKMRADR
jgi:hypothetical protein